MADDGDAGIFGKSADSIKKANKAISETADVNQRLSQTIVPNIGHLGNFADRAKRAAGEAETLNDKLKEGAKAFLKYADETVGSKAALRQFTDMAGSAIGTVKELTSVTNVYNRYVKMLRRGQDLQTKSMQANTAATDKASKGLSKTLEVVQSQYDNAGKMAKKYSMAGDDVIKIQEATLKVFHTNIMAYKDSGKAMSSLTDDVIVLSGAMGTDAPKMIEYLNSRMRASNMTMKEAQNETMKVAKAYDTYKIALTKIPGALQKAVVSQLDFNKTMDQANEAFKMGNLNAGAFAEALVPLQLAGQKAGLNVNAINSLTSGFISMMKTMGGAKLEILFGLQSSMDILGNLDN